MRLNKYISEAGICSRREADALIDEGRVTINGKPAPLGAQVEESDDVRIDGRRVGAPKKHVYIALNKPVGIECTAARVPGNIVDFVNYPERIFPIGRLDKASEGLILLTNNGDIVNEILRSENKHEKEYVVSVKQPVTDEFLEGMRGGVPILDDRTTKPCKVRRAGKFIFNIILTEGMNRQIRRMCEYFGYDVTRLQRVRIINLKLGNLKAGQWRKLKMEEVHALLPHKGKDFNF